MKKKMLFILPALMAISACSGLGKASVEIEKDDFEYFKEDTVAHEELYGEQKDLQPHRLGEPEEANPSTEEGQFTTTPKVGVQFMPYSKDVSNTDEPDIRNFYAVRFVAAIQSNDLVADGITASWTRAVSEKNSNSVKSLSGNHNSTVLYPTLNNGNTPKDASSEGEPGEYNNYVVYNMYDIPVGQAESYIVAYLTLSKEGKDPVKSRVVAAQIDGGHCFSFDMDHDLVKDGYFLQSTASGIIHQKSDGESTDPNDENKDNAFFENVEIDEGEKFGLFRFTESDFKFFGYDKFWDSDDESDGDNRHSSSGYVKSTTIDQYGELYIPGTYNLFVNKWNFVFTSPVSVTTTLYFKPNSNWKEANARFAAHVFHKENDVTTLAEWIDLEETSNGSGIYKGDIEISTHNFIIFLRMNPNNTENRWNKNDDGDNKPVWNQTPDLGMPVDYTWFVNNKMYTINNGWDYPSGSWGSLS